MLEGIKLHKETIIIFTLATILAVGGVLLAHKKDKSNEELFTVGASSAFEGGGWYTVDSFQGFQTRIDPSKINRGGNPNGQNTTVNNGDRVSVREFGFEVVGTVTSTEEAVRTLHTFRKRNGDNIIIRTRGTYVEYYEEENSIWETLISTSTTNLQYGFADYNINTDLRSYTYFGNGVDPFSRWTGAKTTFSSPVTTDDTVLNVVDAFDLTATGSVRFCDTTLAYSSKTDTTITLSASSTVACASGRGIAQAVQEFPSNPRGNIYLIANNRIFIAGVTSTPQAVYFSKYGDATTYLTTLVSDATADAAGIFNLGEGGGGVVGMVQDENSIYIIKRSIIYRAYLSDSLYTLDPLKPFDGKSQTTGGVNNKLLFTSGNEVFFVTPDNQIMSLSRVPDIDYPQIVPISQAIKPTTDNMDFSDGAGIVFQDRAFFAIKSDPTGVANDGVLVWNLSTRQWDSPIVGWSPATWTIYDSGTGENLYFGDATTANVYKLITEDKLDDGFGFTANWRSKRFDFSDVEIPLAHLKEIDSVYIEGYITENTVLNINLLLDEDGFTQTFSTILRGTDTDLMYDAQPFNLFGLHPFGFLPFGTSDTIEKKRFRVYLNRSFRALPFYNLQLEFVSEEENNFWEITSFGFKVRESSQQEKRTLFKEFR